MTIAAVEPLSAERSPLIVAQELKRRNDWAGIAALITRRDELEAMQRLALTDAIAFALGQLQRTPEAIALAEEVYEQTPTHRAAATLAYLHYDAALRLRPGARKRDRERAGRDQPAAPVPKLEDLRRGFRRWIAEALRLAPRSVKDLYRLGIFEAQVESQHDKVALRAFLAAIQAYREMPPEERDRRHDLRQYYVRALYAGGRSALRLRRIRLGRLLSFQCIREDKERDFVAPVHKLGLAGKACLAAGELDHAERAFRLALDGKGPPHRDYLFGMLAEVEHRRGNLAAARRWIESHVRPERRSPAIWRQLGDLRRDEGDTDRALAAYESSLQRDRCGRHLTLIRIGDLQSKRGRTREASQAYRKAIEFARRQYLMEPAAAKAGLAACEAADLAGALPQEPAAVARKPPEHREVLRPVAKVEPGQIPPGGGKLPQSLGPSAEAESSHVQAEPSEIRSVPAAVGKR